MAYIKPGVTVRQVQQTASFPLPAPALDSCVVGKGYYYQDPTSDSSIYETPYAGAELTIPLTYFTDHAVEDWSIVVHLVRTAGPSGNSGEVTVLKLGTDFTYAAAVTEPSPIPAGIVLAADLDGYEHEDDRARVVVSFLAVRSDLANKFRAINSAQDIRDYITGGSEATWFNPLAYGAQLAIQASGARTHIISVNAFADVPAIASTKKYLYSYAALSSADGDFKALKSFAETASLPENKAESIVFGSVQQSDYDDQVHETLDGYAQAIKAVSQSVASKRAFHVYPDVVYIIASAHISHLNPTFINNAFNEEIRDNEAEFTRTTEIDGQLYFAGDKITAAV